MGSQKVCQVLSPEVSGASSRPRAVENIAGVSSSKRDSQSLRMALYAAKQSARLKAAVLYETPAQNPPVSLSTLKLISLSGMAGVPPGFGTAQLPGQP